MVFFVVVVVLVFFFCGFKVNLKVIVISIKINVVCMVFVWVVMVSSDVLKNVGKVLFVVLSFLLLVVFVGVVEVKMGVEDGVFVFLLLMFSVKVGESIMFVNNKGFLYNIVFDEDEVFVGVKVDVLNYEDYLNVFGESYIVMLKIFGSYSFYCEFY